MTLQKKIDEQALAGSTRPRHLNKDLPSEFPVPEFGEHGLEPPQNDAGLPRRSGKPTEGDSVMALPAAEEIKAQIEAGVPGASVKVIQNGSPSAQHSLLLDHAHARAVAEFLRDHADWRLDYCTL